MTTLPDWYQKLDARNKEYLALRGQAWVDKIRGITGAAGVTLDYQEPFLGVSCIFTIEGHEQVVRSVLDLTQGMERVDRELRELQSRAVYLAETYVKGARS